MNLALKALYVGASTLAVIALLLGIYDHFVHVDEQGSVLVDLVLPLGMLVVILLLYRRRKSELEGMEST